MSGAEEGLKRKPTGRRGRPDAEYLEGIRRLAEMLGGRKPKAEDFYSPLAIKAGAPSIGTIYARFGGLEKALELAGVAELPPVRAQEIEEREKRFQEALRRFEGRLYAFFDELAGLGVNSRRLANELKRRGVVVLRRLNIPYLEEALAVYYGNDAESKREMREVMGEKAYEMFARFARGEVLGCVARDLGYGSRTGAVSLLRRKFRRMFQKEDGKKSERNYLLARRDGSGRALIRMLRRQRGMSQVDLARCAGVTAFTVNRAERGGRVSPQTAEKLVQALGVSLEECFCPAGSDACEVIASAKGAACETTVNSDTYEAEGRQRSRRGEGEQTRQDEDIEDVLRKFEGRAYVFLDELSGLGASTEHVKTELEQRGIIVLRRLKIPYLEEALRVYYGDGTAGRERMRKFMGDEAYEMFASLAHGEPLTQIARRFGYKKGGVLYSIVGKRLQWFFEGRRAQRQEYVARPDEGGGTAILALRHHKKMSQAELAEKAGLSLDAVHRAERGLPVTGSTAERLAEALGASLQDCFYSLRSNTSNVGYTRAQLMQGIDKDDVGWGFGQPGRYKRRKERRLTDEECLESIRRLARLLGNRRPRSRDFNSDLAREARAPCFATILKRFGTLARALELAGVADLPVGNCRVVMHRKSLELEQAIQGLASKPYVFADELRKYGRKQKLVKEELRKRGIAVLQRINVPAIERILNLFFGSEAQGLTRNEMRQIMGERAYEWFSRYAAGDSPKKIALSAGCSRQWVHDTIRRGLKRLLLRLRQSENLSGASKAFKASTGGENNMNMDGLESMNIRSGVAGQGAPALHIVEEWDNYPVKGHLWAIGAGAGGWFFYRGPRNGLQLERPETGVGQWEWRSSEEEARIAREEGLRTLKTVGNRRLVPGIGRAAIAYNVLRGTNSLALSIAVPHAGVLELVLLQSGPGLRDAHLSHEYLQELADRSGLELDSVYSDLAAAVVEAVEESGFPLPGVLEWERSEDGVRWKGDFAGYLGPQGALLEFAGPLTSVLTLEEVARLWRVPARRVAKVLGRGEFPGGFRRSGGTWLLEWDAVWEVFGPPLGRKRKDSGAYFRVQVGSMELEYKGAEEVIRGIAGPVVEKVLKSVASAVGAGNPVQSVPQTAEEARLSEIEAVRCVADRKEFRGHSAALIALYFIGTPASPSQIFEWITAAGFQCTMPSVYSYLTTLKGRELVKKTTSGRYMLTARGRAEAAELIQDAVRLARILKGKAPAQ